MRRTNLLRRQRAVAPTAAWLEAFRTSATMFTDVPYGRETWEEPTLGNALCALKVDIYKSSAAVPAGGRKIMAWAHPNSVSKTVGASGDTRNFLDAWLADGNVFVSYEFRHPVVNVAHGAPHNDIGRATQMVRALAPLLEANPDEFYGLCRSRGSLMLWQALQPDLADPKAATYAGRMSSLMKALFVYNGQTTYDTQQAADLFVLEADRPAFMALNPNDSRWGSAITSVATAPFKPYVAIVNEFAYYNSLQSAATVSSNVHYPDMTRALREAYVAAGARDRIVDFDLEPTANPYAKALEWFKAIAAGCNALEAMALSIAKANSAFLVYAKSTENVYSDDAGTTPVTLGGTIANLGAKAGSATFTQTTAADRPTAETFGRGVGARFNDTSDHLVASAGSGNTGTLIAVGQTDTTTFPAALIGNAPNSTGTPGAVLRIASSAGVQLRLTGASGSNAAAAAFPGLPADVHAIEGWWDGSNVYVKVDGSAAGSAAQTVNPTNAAGFALGRTRTGGSGVSWGGVGGLWFGCSAVLSDRDRSAIARYGMWLANATYPD